MKELDSRPSWRAYLSGGGLLAGAFMASLAIPHLAIAHVTDAAVERLPQGRLALTWKSGGPTDVYVSGDPADGPENATLVSSADDDGRFESDAGADRRYFVIRDRSDGSVVKVAERLVPLEQGTNFRDLGGYPAANGKHVRWGRIFRSAGTAMLTDGDLDSISKLQLGELIDLRSNEERDIAPTRIDHVHYHAVGYPMASLVPEIAVPGEDSAKKSGGYGKLPVFLKTHVRIVFNSLLANDGSVAYFCSGGQDRTGVVSALVLSALGTPRDVIEADYHLTTKYLRPGVGMPAITPEMVKNNPTAAYFAKFREVQPRPLFDATGKSLLTGFFEAIEARWGTVDSYLREEIGLTDADIAKLRALYLE